MNTNIKYVMYVRSDNDKELKKKILKLNKIAKKEKLNVVKVIGIGGRSEDRISFNKIIKDIEMGKINGILTCKLNRLSRSFMDTGRITHLFDSGKLKKIKTMNIEYVPEEYLLKLLAEFSYIDNFTKKLIKRRIKGGLEYKARSGYVPSRVPIGYINDKVNKKIIKDKNKFNVMVGNNEFNKAQTN